MEDIHLTHYKLCIIQYILLPIVWYQCVFSNMFELKPPYRHAISWVETPPFGLQVLFEIWRIIWIFSTIKQTFYASKSRWNGITVWIEISIFSDSSVWASQSCPKSLKIRVILTEMTSLQFETLYQIHPQAEIHRTFYCNWKFHQLHGTCPLLRHLSNVTKPFDP